MGDVAVKQTHPKGFYTCSLTYTFERFAYYGTKSLLVLFLGQAIATGGIGLSKGDATVIGSYLVAFTYFAPIIGGIICDNWIGARYAVPIGMVIMGIGYLIGWQAYSVGAVYAMIAVISIGTGLFKGNLAALIGRLYDDPKKLDSAFSIQYTFVNIGSFFGSLLAGYLYLHLFADGDILGFRQTFLVCGIVVLIGAVFFVAFWKFLGNEGKKPFKIKDATADVKQIEKKPLTTIEKKRVAAICLISFFSVIFWIFYYQAGTSLSFYMRDYVDMFIGGFEVPPIWIDTSLNGLLCIILGPIMAMIWFKLAQRPKGDLTMFQKTSLGFILLGGAFVMMALAELTRGPGAASTVKASIIWLIFFDLFQTFGEMCFSPLGNSFVSKFAPAKFLALLMGVWTVATFIASLLAGYVQKVMDSIGIMATFITIPIILIVSGVVLVVLNTTLNKLVTGTTE